jgi:hypothetical protein
MKKVGAITILVVFSGFLAPYRAFASGPVTVNESADAIVLSNDYLGRTLQVTDGAVATTQFWNKISHRVYAVSGDEFQLKLTFEQMGADFRNPFALTSKDFRVVDRKVEDVEGGGRRVVFHLALRGPFSEWTGVEVKLVYELKPEDYYTRQWIQVKLVYEPKPEDYYTRQWSHLRTAGKGTCFIDSIWVQKNEWGLATFSHGGFGQPLFTEDLFMGLEYPSSMNTAQGADVTLGSVVGINIPPEGFTSEPAVIGVAAAGGVHRAFMKYVDRIRMAPPQFHIFLNTWDDLRGTLMNAQNVLEVLSQVEQKLLKKYSLSLFSFTLDDGWDGPQELWRIDKERFPNGFQELRSVLKRMDSNLSLWFGPMGGYPYHKSPVTTRADRVGAGIRQGMEINSTGDYLCLAGRNYSRYLRETMVSLIKEYGQNYFKLDGIPFACNQPDHGHPVGVYSREAYVGSVINLVKAVHAANPQAVIDLATGPWLSPWWLRYADTVDYGGGDYGWLEAVPFFTPRQGGISYYDSILYNNYRVKGMEFPMSSLSGCGVAKGKFTFWAGEHESLDDWNDAVISFVGWGNTHATLSLSPALLKPEEWDGLGRSLQYMVRNAHPLLDNGTFVLGDPNRGEPYGLLHFSPEKTILRLRNPFVRPARVTLRLDDQAGFERTDRSFRVEVVYPFREALPGTLRYGDTLDMDLDGYEQRIVELHSVKDDEARVEGVRYSVQSSDDGGVHFIVYAPDGSRFTARLPHASAYEKALADGEKIALASEGNQGTLTLQFGKKGARESEPTYSAPSIQVRGEEGSARSLNISLTVGVPTDFQDSRIAVLLEPWTKSSGMKASPEDDVLTPLTSEGLKAEIHADGKPAAVAVRKGNEGLWYWFTTDVGAGSHALEFNVQLPAEMRGRTKISGWFRGNRLLGKKDLRLTFKAGQRLSVPPGDVLPASSQIERETYAIFEKVVP